MECEECGSDGASPVAVEFTDGVESELPLCEGCRDDYRDGTFVEDVAND